MQGWLSPLACFYELRQVIAQAARVHSRFGMLKEAPEAACCLNACFTTDVSIPADSGVAFSQPDFSGQCLWHSKQKRAFRLACLQPCRTWRRQQSTVFGQQLQLRLCHCWGKGSLQRRWEGCHVRRSMAHSKGPVAHRCFHSCGTKGSPKLACSTQFCHEFQVPCQPGHAGAECWRSQLIARPCIRRW